MKLIANSREMFGPLEAKEQPWKHGPGAYKLEITWPADALSEAQFYPRLVPASSLFSRAVHGFRLNPVAVCCCLLMLHLARRRLFQARLPNRISAFLPAK